MPSSSFKCLIISRNAIISLYIDTLSKQKEFLITWEEFEGYLYPGKPDKVKLSVRKDDEKLFVLWIFLHTGRIQCQGLTYVNWVKHDFPELLNKVNELSTNQAQQKEDKITSQEGEIESDSDESNDSCEDEDSVTDDSVTDKSQSTTTNAVSLESLETKAYLIK